MMILTVRQEVHPQDKATTVILHRNNNAPTMTILHPAHQIPTTTTIDPPPVPEVVALHLPKVAIHEMQNTMIEDIDLVCMLLRHLGPHKDHENHDLLFKH
jgi:hypothetical protein